MLCLWLGFTGAGGGWFGVSRELLITQPLQPRPLSSSLSEKSCDFRIPILGEEAQDGLRLWELRRYGVLATKLPLVMANASSLPP